MNKYLLVAVLLVLLGNLNTYSQSPADIIQAAEKLESNRQYFSAFDTLIQADPEHQNPDLVLKKVELTLAYFTVSVMHQAFGFADLKPEDDLYELRGKAKANKIFDFKINFILDSLIQKYPEDVRLRLALGNFYYDCHLRYDNNWMKKNDTLFSLITQNYQAVNASGLGNFWSYYALGYIKAYEGNYGESIELFEESIRLNPDYPGSYYDLAHAYYYLDQKEKAIETAEKTLDLFSDSTRKADAARLIGNIYNELGQNEAAIAYYQKSDSIDPHHYLTTKNLLIQYLKIHHPQLGSKREAFFLLGPKNPTIYLDLSAIYIAENQTRNLIDFFEDQIGNYRNDIRVRANLYYYSGNLYLEFDEEKAAKNLTKARKLFAKFVPEGNRIFEMIDRTLYKL